MGFKGFRDFGVLVEIAIKRSYQTSKTLRKKIRGTERQLFLRKLRNPDFFYCS